MRNWIVVGIFVLLSISLALSADEAKPTENTASQGLFYNPQTKLHYSSSGIAFNVEKVANQPSGGRIEVSVDGRAYEPFEKSVRFTREGKHTIRFRASDELGQTSDLQSITFYLDATPAETNLQVGPSVVKQNGTYYLSKMQDLQLGSHDALSGVREIQVSGDGQTFAPYTGKGQIKPGQHRLYYRAIDHVGNVEKTKSIDYAFSDVPPKTVMDVNPPFIQKDKKYFVGDSYVLSLAVRSDVIPVKETVVVLDGRQFTYQQPFQLSSPGEHEMSYYSVDICGNVEKPTTLLLVTDARAPQTTILPNEKSTTRIFGGLLFVGPDFNLSLKANDEESGISQVLYRTDSNSPFITYKDPIKVSQDGFHTISARSFDAVGNEEVPQEISFVADITPPKTSVQPARAFFKKEGKIVSPYPNALSFQAEDNLSGVDSIWVSVNGAEFKPYQSPVELPKMSQNKIAYKSMDRMGNSEATQNLLIEMNILDGKPVKIIATKEAVEETDVPAKKASSSGKRKPASN